MILYYAAGGGLGHLTRSRAVCHTLGIPEKSVCLLTSSPWGADKRVVGKCQTVFIPQGRLDQKGAGKWLSDLIEALHPDEIYIDAFPAGILGEFSGLSFPKTPIYHIARLIQWEKYVQYVSPQIPFFKKTYLVESLSEAHEQALMEHSEETRFLELIYPPENPSGEIEDSLKEISREKKLYLVLHSGPWEETEELISYGEESSFLEGVSSKIAVLTPQPIPCPGNVPVFDVYPAYPLFPLADCIISGCGFNTMKQVEKCKKKHHFLPFHRQWDNQFLRASRYRSYKRF